MTAGAGVRTKRRLEDWGPPTRFKQPSKPEYVLHYDVGATESPPSAWELLDAEHNYKFIQAYNLEAHNIHRIVEESVRGLFVQRLAEREMIESLSQRVDQIQQSVELLQRDVVELVPIVRESSGTLPLVRGLADSLKQCIESIRRVAQRPTSDWIPIGSFAPEPYEVTQTITVVVSPVGDEFEAGIVDINAYTTGDTSEEAVRNLKSYLLDLFDRYSEIADEQLGPEPLRQKAYLLGHVRRR